uniref:Uncharacterized protein n=1 Tax=Lepeophtheirus salmonis TaxID=72036 RepID=A0A0K2T707_LEPSM
MDSLVSSVIFSLKKSCIPLFCLSTTPLMTSLECCNHWPHATYKTSLL